MSRIGVEPDLLCWAMERGRKPSDTLKGRFPKLEAWLTGDAALDIQYFGQGQ